MTSKKSLSKLSFKAKESAIKAINSVDIFDEAVHLNLEGDRMVSSSIGGILSLAVFIFLGTQSIIQTVAMFNRADPKIVQTNEYQNDPSSVYLNSTNNFIFAVGFTKNNAPMDLSDNSLFSFTTTYSQYIRSSDGNQMKYKPAINWAPCSESNFSSSIYGGDDVFSTYNLKYAYCPTYVNYTDPITSVCPAIIRDEYPGCITPPNFMVKGTYLSMDFRFISFRLTTCKSVDAQVIHGLKCASGDLNAAFTGNEMQLNLYFSNSLIDLTNYGTPNKTFFNSIYWNVNPSVARVADIFIDSETVQDVDSYISNDAYHNSTYYSIQSEKMRELQQFSSKYMLQWNFRRSNINHVTTRTYTKVLDVISDIGGIGSILMVFGVFLTIGYTRFKYQMILSNELYDYQAVEKKPKESKLSNKIHQSTMDHSTPKGGSVISAILTFRRNRLAPVVERTENSAKTVKDYFDNLTAIKRYLPFDEMAYVKSIFRGLFSKYDPEEHLAKKGRAQVIRDLDIIKVIEKLQEIDKLKLLLLNRYQREAFDFIEKPLITVENKRPIQRGASLMQTPDESPGQPQLSVFHTREEFKSYSKFTKLYAAYRQLETDQEPRNKAYNKRLLDMLGANLTKVFRHVDQAMGENPDPRLFEETVSKLLHEPIYEGGDAGINVYSPNVLENEMMGVENEGNEGNSILDVSKQNLLDISKQVVNEQETVFGS